MVSAALAAPHRAILCVVAGADAPAEALGAAVAGGADWVQLRERALPTRALLAWADAVVAAAHAAGGGERAVKILVNRRVDVALAAEADGVHLGFDAMSPVRAHALLGAGRLVGVSVHAPAELGRAAADGADYAHLAPIFAPFSKPPERPALGLGALAAARDAGLPVLAQGGIDAARAAAAVRAGAAGVAVTGAVLGAADPRAAAGALRAALDAAAAETRA
jgi:thiamine-phosphate pyrophosphorylase